MRETALLCIGCAFNLCFAAFKLAMGILFASPWHGAIGVYYTVLGGMRIMLIRNRFKAGRMPTPTQRLLQEYRGYKACGGMMLILNVGITGIVTQITRHSESFHYPIWVIGIFAIYALMNLNLTFFNFIRFRKSAGPNRSAVKILSFCMALVSVLSLQTAMFAQFGQSFAHGAAMNISLSCIICLSMIGFAAFMLLKATHSIETLEKEIQEG